MKKKILIIVNPRSGTQRKKRIAEQAKQYIDGSKYDYEIAPTEYAKHSIEMAQQAVANNYDMVVVAGGDGSIHEVAQVLNNTDVSLGIIPVGSGNGLARHLSIPLNVRKALELINAGHTTQIDTGLLNGRVFVSNAGVGFVSSVVDTFQHSKVRGFNAYSQHTFLNFLRYKRQTFTLKFENGDTVTDKFFLINICNTNQFGYNARIAPGASVHDGLLDVIAVKNAPLWKFPYLLLQMFMGTLKPNDNISRRACRKVEIHFENTTSAQLDGEANTESHIISSEVSPLSLKVIVPGHVEKA